MKRTRRGLTIVELLIVIVVIGILSAISVTVYTGMQDRAAYSLVSSNAGSIAKSIELYKAEHGTYPSAIDTCPAAGTGICADIDQVNDVAYSYQSEGTGDSYRNPAEPEGAYDLSIMGDRQFIYIGQGPRTGYREFTQYFDAAPFIDRYGIREYELSFDVKSADTSSRSGMTLYFQNGSGAKYQGLSYGFNATEEFERHTVRFIPAGPNTSHAAAYLAFYGIYDTGNRPIVKNVEFRLAP